MTTRLEAQTELRTRALTASGFPPPERCAWQNRQFTPPVPPLDLQRDGAGTLWVEDHFLLGPSTAAELGNPVPVHRTELYQLSIRLPKGIGVAPALALADALEDVFRATPIGVDAENGGVALTVLDVTPGPPQTETTWWHLPVSIAYTYDH